MGKIVYSLTVRFSSKTKLAVIAFVLLASYTGKAIALNIYPKAIVKTVFTTPLGSNDSSDETDDEEGIEFAQSELINMSFLDTVRLAAIWAYFKTEQYYLHVPKLVKTYHSTVPTPPPDYKSRILSNFYL